MVKKTLMAGGLGAGFAVMALVSIVAQAPIDEPMAALAVPVGALPASHIDAFALTLKARNLPIQPIDNAI
jgi:hypothetical protein